VIDLGSQVQATGFRLLPRQTSPNNGRPNHFDLYLSNNRSAWGPAVLSDSVPDSSNLYSHSFPAVSCHFLRLVVKDGHRSEPFLAVSEIGLIRRLNANDQKNWASQYNIANVQVGGDQFDLTGASLEQAKSQELRATSAKKWESATLPHAAWIRPLGSSDIWQGVAYYKRSFSRPKKIVGKLAILTLEGAMQRSDLWLNGKHIATRFGGYLPMVVNLTPFLKDRNELLVRLDNRDNPLIPPGKPQQELDFMYGSGIYRNAFLTLTPALHITDPILENLPRSGGIAVTLPAVGASEAIVRVRTHVRNSGGAAATFRVTQKLRDTHGRVVATTFRETALPAGSAEQVTLELSVSHPDLWFPDSPSLYRLETALQVGRRVVDSVATQIGIRKVEVSRQRGFVINGRPIRLVGTNRHQDYPWVGPALSDAANARDALQIRLAGHNIVRLSHYPQSTSFLDACDRVGLLTIPCIPGWQFMNSDPRFVSRVAQDIRDLIRRDRNHPCAAFWETSLNETYPPAVIAREWDAVAKSESIDGNILTAGDAAKGAHWDVAYNQWKEDLSRPQNNAPDRPGYIREYGDYEFGGGTSTSRVSIGQGIDKLLEETWNHVWSHNKFRPQYPWTMGDGTWEMFDHNVPWDYKVSASGLSDLFRRPKPSFWFYASQVADRPMLKIAATWQPGNARRTIVVFTNCDEARLSIDGHVVSVQRPVLGKATNYGDAKRFDGSNTANLTHPPIVFRNVPYHPGTLTVTGFIHGMPKTQDSIETAGTPVRLKVWIDDLGVRPQPNDLVFVRAALVDRKGTINPSVVRTVRFDVAGATLAGEGAVESEMGVATALVRTSVKGGAFALKASTNDGLHGRL
jgi:beta-galactosidase